MGGSGYLVWNIGLLSADESASMQELSESTINSSMILSNSNIKDTAEPTLKQSNPEIPSQIEDSQSATNKLVIAEEPLTKAAKTLTPEAKSVSSNNNRNKRRASSAHKRKKLKKTISSDPNIDDRAKDFFGN